MFLSVYPKGYMREPDEQNGPIRSSRALEDTARRAK
jgi:hypothetical protein